MSSPQLSPVRDWLRANPDVAATARGRIGTAGKAFPDAVLTAPALMADLYRELTLEALRREAPFGVAEQLLAALRRMQAGARRLESKGFVRAQLAALEGLRDRDEIVPVLNKAVGEAADESDRVLVQRLLDTARSDPFKPKRPTEPTEPPRPKPLPPPEAEIAAFGAGVGGEVGAAFIGQHPDPVALGIEQGQQHALTLFQQFGPGGGSSGGGPGLFELIGGAIGGFVGGLLGGAAGAGLGAVLGGRIGAAIDHELDGGPGTDDGICDVCPDFPKDELCMPCMLVVEALTHPGPGGVTR